MRLCGIVPLKRRGVSNDLVVEDVVSMTGLFDAWMLGCSHKTKVNWWRVWGTLVLVFTATMLDHGDLCQPRLSTFSRAVVDSVTMAAGSTYECRPFAVRVCGMPRDGS